MGFTRGRRVYIVKNGEDQPDFWPHDEVWADDFTLLGKVDAEGNFVPNPQAGSCLVN
jgi:hypothetical protein